jgi:hypothetical protein
MGELVGSIGRGLGELVARLVALTSNTLHTIGGIVPGGLPIFAVLVTIAILVFLATLKRAP